MKVSHIRNALLGASALAAATLVAGQASADIAVYVGYADNLRASGFFPTPWIGDSGVVSQSPGAQTFDSGAFRIDNNGASAISITEISVFFPSNSSTYTLWNDVTLNPGEIGIFAQNNFVDTQFDTSDFGIFGGLPPGALAPSGADLIGGCSAPSLGAYQAQCDAAIPVISFKLDGVLMSFSDTGHILDTGEWDFVNNTTYGEDGNESINWNLVGAPPNRGGTDVPEPLTMSLFGAGLAGMAYRKRKAK
jgi:hypothetical protein